jgi:hypothetical protein
MEDTATACPNCGAPKEEPRPAEKSVRRANPLWFIIGGIIVAVVVLFLVLPSRVKQSIGMEEENGLYRIQQVSVHIDGNDFVGNDDGLSGYYAPEPYVHVEHNGKEILSTRNPEDKWDFTWQCSVDLVWAKGDTLKAEVWDKDLMDDDHLFTFVFDHISSGVLKRGGNSWVELTLTKIK